MSITALSGLNQFIDDVLRGRLIGIAHTKIDNILTPRPSLRLKLVDDIKDIWG